MLADNLSTSPHRSGNGGGWTEREIKGKRKRESKVNENYHINLVSTFRCSPLFCTDCVIRRAMEQLAVCFMEGPGLSGVGRDEFSSAVVIRHLEVSVCEVYQEMKQWWCASGEMTACPSLSPNREPQETTNMSWSQFRQAYKFWLACLTGKAIWLWIFFFFMWIHMYGAGHNNSHKWHFYSAWNPDWPQTHSHSSSPNHHLHWRVTQAWSHCWFVFPER